MHYAFIVFTHGLVKYWPYWDKHDCCLLVLYLAYTFEVMLVVL